MSNQNPDLKEFYESRIWKSHRIANPYEVARLRHISTFLAIDSSDTVLGVGCGGGTYTSILAKANLTIAIDVSSSAIKRARYIKERLILKDNFLFVVCDLEHLPIRDVAVNKVACIDVLEHVKKPQKAVNEMSRVLCSHGKILLAKACGENKFTLECMLRPFLGKFINSIRSMLGHVSIFTTQKIRRMLSQDFKIVHIEYMHHWEGWLIKFCWDATHINSPQGYQSQFETSSSSLPRMLWLPLEAEYKFLKERSLGTETVVEASKEWSARDKLAT
jgi:ubiquinone/menaquinone biosynthesis C-methylase UbiE